MTFCSATLGLALALTASPSLDVRAESCGGVKKFIDSIDFVTENLKVAVHRSGEADPCAVIPITADGIAQALSKQSLCDVEVLEKYDLDIILTSYILSYTDKDCGPVDDFTMTSTVHQAFSAFCDAGPNRTPIQPDHKRIKAVAETNSLPCRFYSREGRRIGSVDALSSLVRKAKESASSCVVDESLEETCSVGPVLHLKAVPSGRVFQFAPSFVGEKFVVDHVHGHGPIVAEVLSVEPRIFELHGFFSEEEGDQLIQRALREVSETHKLHRSTTGAVGGSVFR